MTLVIASGDADVVGGADVSDANTKSIDVDISRDSWFNSAALT